MPEVHLGPTLNSSGRGVTEVFAGAGRYAVRLEPIRLEWAEALNEGDDTFSERFGIPVEADWMGLPDTVPVLLEAAREAIDEPWRPHLFFGSDGALIGTGGWKGPPEDGVAELGYAVAPSRQRQGIATAVVRHFVGEARNAGLRTVRAHTLAQQNASTAVLSRCGFTRAAELDDPDEGPVWRWEIQLSPPIRVADPLEWDLLRGIEEAADEMFLEVGIGPFQSLEEDNHLATAAVVLVSGNPPNGFACVDVVDGVAHLWQLSVHPASGRRGIGRALVDSVCDWARSSGFRAVTLTTFRDVPWNAPFYSRLGFRILDELPPGLALIREHEKQIGDDDFGPRVAMRKDLL